jgi:uncharacterized membrane protein YvlD (DUF360 family)
MMEIAVEWGAMSALLLVAAGALKSVEVRSWPWAVMGAGVFGALNIALGWLLTLVTSFLLFLPSLLTLGLLGLLVPIVVNMVLLHLADRVTKDHVKIKGVMALVTLAVVVSLGGAVIHYILHAATAA